MMITQLDIVDIYGWDTREYLLDLFDCFKIVTSFGWKWFVLIIWDSFEVHLLIYLKELILIAWFNGNISKYAFNNFKDLKFIQNLNAKKILLQGKKASLKIYSIIKSLLINYTTMIFNVFTSLISKCLVFHPIDFECNYRGIMLI